MELHVVRRFRHLNDLRETRCALPHLRWRHVVAGGSPRRRIPLPRVSRAALLVLDLHPVDVLAGTFRKRADMPVLDVSGDVNPFNLGIQCLAFSRVACQRSYVTYISLAPPLYLDSVVL